MGCLQQFKSTNGTTPLTAECEVICKNCHVLFFPKLDGAIVISFFVKQLRQKNWFGIVTKVNF